MTNAQPSRPARTLLLAIAFALLPGAAAATAQKAWTHPTLGFSITPPKKWIWQPPTDDRGVLIAAFTAPKAQARKEGLPHVSSLRIVRLEDSAQSAQEHGMPAKVGYHDLESYVRGEIGTGTTIAGRSEGKLGGFEAQRFTVRVIRTRDKRTVFGGIVKVGEQRLLIAADVAESHLGKAKKPIELSFKSLKAATAPADTPAEDGGPMAAPWSDAEDWAGKDAAARDSARKAFAEAVVKAANPAREPGWRTYKNKHYTVLSAADAGMTKKALKAVDAAWAWCDKHFAKVSDREQLPAVLRIFPSREHFADFQRSTFGLREFSPDRRELYFFEDPNAGTSNGYGMLFRAVFWHWLEDEAPGCSDIVPRWLGNGLREYFRSTQLKGRKISFEPSDVEAGRIRNQMRGESLPPLWNLIEETMQPTPEDGGAEEPWGYTPECARLIRWLVDHDGNKAFGKKDLLGEYLVALGEIAQTAGRDPRRMVDQELLQGDQKTELRKLYYTWRDEALKATNGKCVSLDIDFWKKVNAQWNEFNKKYK